MSKKIKVGVELEVKDSKTLMKKRKEAEELANAINKAAYSHEHLNKVTEKYSKTAKGVAQLGANNSKNFSKMSQGISGSLVPAYATLAASIFAVSAGFNALRKAAALEQLEAGLIRVGNAGGKDLLTVADNLAAITGGAIAAADAMAAVAIGTSAGFSTKQMEGLTRVAKGASLALGRDMSDAMNRLTRGAAKLEPEILDELGIMVRLDDATEAYATTIGTTAAQLTQFQRRMAFTNAIVDQGTKKFGEIEKAIDPNPYDRLAATFRDLTKDILGLASVFSGLVNGLADSKVAIIGLMAAFGAGLIRQVIPAISTVAAAQADLANKSAANAENIARVHILSAKKAEKAVRDLNAAAAAKNLSAFDNAPKSLLKMEKGLRSGTVGVEKMRLAVKNLEKSEKLRDAYLASDAPKDVIRRKAELANIVRLKKEIQGLIVLEQQRNAIQAPTKSVPKALQAKASSNISGTTAAGMTQMESAGLKQSFSIARQASKKMFGEVAAGTSKLGKASLRLKAAAGSARLFGTAMLGAVPAIGTIIMLLGIIGPLLWDLFPKDKVKDRLDELIEGFDSFHGISLQLSSTLKELGTDSARFVAGLQVSVGVLDQITSAVSKLEEARKTAGASQLKALNDKKSDLQAALLNQESGSWGEDRILKNLVALDKSIASITAQYGKLNKTRSTTLINAAMSSVRENKALSSVMTQQLSALAQIKADIASGKIENEAELQEALKKAQAPAAALTASIEAAKSSYATFSKAVIGYGSKMVTPIDAMVTGLQSLSNEAMTAGKNSHTLTEFVKALAQPKFIAHLQALYGKGFEGSHTIADVIKAAAKDMKDYQVSIATADADMKKHQQSAKALSKLTGLLPSAVKAYHIEMKLATEAKLRGLKDTLAAENMTQINTAKSLATKKEIAKLEAQLNTTAQRSYDIAKAEVAQNKLFIAQTTKLVAAQKARLDLATKQAATNITGGSGDLGAAGEVAVFEKLKKSKIDLITAEAELKASTIDNEYALLDAKFKLLVEEAKVSGVKLDTAFVKNYSDALQKGRSASKEALTLATRVALLNLDTTGSEKRLALAKDTASVLQKTAESTASRLTSRASDIDPNSFENIGKRRDAEIQAINAAGVAKTLATAKSLQEEQDAISRIANARVTQLATVEEAKAALADKGGEDSALSDQLTEEKGILADIEANAAAHTAALADLEEQKTQNALDRIKKIEDAEKKSRQAKVSMALSYYSIVETVGKAYAAAQDQETKAGFEKAKKMNMALAVMSTAVAIIRAFSDLGWPAGIPAAAAAAATGAAQIASISSTSFEGGGSISPASVSVGSAQSSGTVLGDPSKSSNSASNVSDILESIHAKEYRELRSISYSMEDLNRNIKGLVNSIVRGPEPGTNALSGVELGSVDPLKDIIGSVSSTVRNFVDGLDSQLGELFGSSDVGLFLGHMMSGGGSVLYRAAADVANWFGSAGSKIFGGKVKTSITEQGFILAEMTAGSLLDGADAYVQEYAVIKKKKSGGWFKSSKTSYSTQYGEATDEVTSMFTSIFKDMSSSVAVLAAGLGGDLALEAAKAYEFNIGKISLKGLSPEAINDKLNAIISTQGDLFTEAILGPLISIYQKVDEGLMETAVRLLVSKALVTDSFTKLGKAFNSAETVLLDSLAGSILIADSIIDLAGGLEAYQKTFESFFDLFFSDIEKQSYRAANLEGIFSDMGESVPLSRAAYRDLTAAMDVSTASGRAAYVQLLELSELAGSYYDYLEGIASNTFDLQIELMEALGYESQALAFSREKELEAMDPVLHALQRTVWAAQDAAEAEGNLADARNTALQEAEEALRKSFQAQKDIITETFGGIIEALNADITSTSDNISKLTSAVSSLDSARSGMNGNSLADIARALSGMSSIRAGVATGDLSGLENLDKHLAVLTTDNSDQYSQFEDYRRDSKLATLAINGLYKETSDMLSTEELSLEALKSQLDVAESTRDLQLEALDTQLDAILGVDNSVLSIAEATTNYHTAKAAVDAAAAEAAAQALALQQSSLAALFDIQAAIAMLTPAQQASIPGFASGGTFNGGWRVVGEQGPELEHTGPSRVYNNSDSLFDTSALETEIRELRMELKASQYQIAKNTGETSRLMDRWDGDGMPETRDVI